MASCKGISPTLCLIKTVTEENRFKQDSDDPDFESGE